MTRMQDAADAEFLAELLEPHPIAEYHEDMGPVIWWRWELIRWAGEPPYVGGPNDLGQTVEIDFTVTAKTHACPEGEDVQGTRRISVGGWIDGYYTHFTPIPKPTKPKQL